MYLAIQTSNQRRHRDAERLADAQQGRHGDRPPRLDLLPVPSREAEGDHVLLAVPGVPAQRPDPPAQGPEEFLLIPPPVCRVHQRKHDEQISESQLPADAAGHWKTGGPPTDGPSGGGGSGAKQARR